MYDTVDALHDCVRIATGVLSTLSINPDRMMKVRTHNSRISEKLAEQGPFLLLDVRSNVGKEDDGHRPG